MKLELKKKRNNGSLIMEYLGLPAVEAIERLNARNIKFKMNYTVPAEGVF